MDSRIGLDYIVENAEYTTKLGAGKTEVFFQIQIKVLNVKTSLKA